MALDRRNFTALLASGLALRPGRAAAYDEAACTRSHQADGWTLSATHEVFRVNSGPGRDRVTTVRMLHDATGIGIEGEQVDDAAPVFTVAGLNTFLDGRPAFASWFENTQSFPNADLLVSRGNVAIGVLEEGSDWEWWVHGRAVRRGEGIPLNERYRPNFQPGEAYSADLIRRFYDRPDARFTLRAVGVGTDGTVTPLREETMTTAGLVTLAEQHMDATLAELETSVSDEACVRGCFLTTACCDAFGRPDDGVELSTLRRFRDGWMSDQPGGAADIATYRRIAPRITAAIAADPNGRLELMRIYAGTILPCVALIRLGLNRAAWVLYRRMVERLQVKYGAPDRTAMRT